MLESIPTLHLTSVQETTMMEPIATLHLYVRNYNDGTYSDLDHNVKYIQLVTQRNYQATGRPQRNRTATAQIIEIKPYR